MLNSQNIDLDLEVALENKYGYLLNVQKYLNISSSFTVPKSINKIQANFRHFETASNPLPISFSELESFATGLYTKIGEAVLYDDIKLYIADKIWDNRLFSGKIISAHWAILAALRVTVRTLRGMFHEGFQGIKKYLKSVNDLMGGDWDTWIIDQIYQKTDKLAIKKYDYFVHLLSKNYPNLLKGQEDE